MSLSTQPDIHRSLDSNNIPNQLPPSLEGGLSDNLYNAAHCYLRHTTRVTNSSDIDKKMEMKINFPRSNEKIWCKINEELEIMIPKVFTNRQMDKLSTTELSEKFDSWLHSFFLQCLGKRTAKFLTRPRGRKDQTKL